MLIIITTRRTGYDERIAPEHFDQLDLDYLTLDEATRYGRYITNLRLHDDVTHRDRVLSRFDEATRNPTMERLLQTPLQVLILTIVLGSSGQLPTTRYRLFWKYFETVFNREASKNTTYREFFRQYREAITELHQVVGLLLQTECESTGEIHARMPRAHLQHLARQYMLDEGHDEGASSKFADTVFTVSTQRLVLLSADKDETVSFDVRSLQELMAGCALVDGDDDEIRANLTATAFSPHWRNAWLFAAGRLFDRDRHRREVVLDIVEHCDEKSAWPAWLYPAAPELAAYLLEDGLAASRPKDQRRLVEVALRCLSGPVPQDPEAIAHGLNVAASLSTLHSTLIRNGISSAVAGCGAGQAIARTLMHYAQYGSSRVPGSYTQKDLQQAADMWRFRIPCAPENRVTVEALLRPKLDALTAAVSAGTAELARRAIAECAALVLARTEGGGLWPLSTGSTMWSDMFAALDNLDAAELLELCIGGLDIADWAAQSMLARSVAASAGRKPVSDQLVVKVPQLDSEVGPFGRHLG